MNTHFEHVTEGVGVMVENSAPRGRDGLYWDNLIEYVQGAQSPEDLQEALYVLIRESDRYGKHSSYDKQLGQLAPEFFALGRPDMGSLAVSEMGDPLTQVETLCYAKRFGYTDGLNNALTIAEAPCQDRKLKKKMLLKVQEAAAEEKNPVIGDRAAKALKDLAEQPPNGGFRSRPRVHKIVRRVTPH